MAAPIFGSLDSAGLLEALDSAIAPTCMSYYFGIARRAPPDRRVGHPRASRRHLRSVRGSQDADEFLAWAMTDVIPFDAVWACPVPVTTWAKLEGA